MVPTSATLVSGVKLCFIVPIDCFDENSNNYRGVNGNSPTKCSISILISTNTYSTFICVISIGTMDVISYILLDCRRCYAHQGNCVRNE